ncbi:hypothetical protein HPB50_028292 [Hyalomma asiaticum]|nr:hypothetical protein HPB50_028292 [Hyalomma asiaticum]
MKTGTRNVDQLEVWQWKCRGFRCKQGLLQPYIAMTSVAPDVILLQEPNCVLSLEGFEANGIRLSSALVRIRRVTSVEGADPGTTGEGSNQRFACAGPQVAFGNGEHESNLIELRCGVRVYNYVQAFATVPQHLVQALIARVPSTYRAEATLKQP